jgi:hypothetical protein
VAGGRILVKISRPFAAAMVYGFGMEQSTDGYNLRQMISSLHARGYIEDFYVRDDQLRRASGQIVGLDDMHVDDVYRFDVMTDPDDQAILYALSSAKLGLKGLLVDGFGLSADPVKAGIVSRLS